MHADRAPGPIRTCVGCRARTLASELLRVVAGSGGYSGTAIPDPRRRHPGRGAWIHLDPTCLRLAEKRRVFPRALRVRGPLDLSPVTEHLEQSAQNRTDVGPARVRQHEGSRSTRHESAVKLKP